MVDARETLVQFLHEALAMKRDRLCMFASKPKTQHKFLDELHHGFGSYIASSVVVSDLPPSAWSAPALAFDGSGQFSEPFKSIREAWDSLDLNQGVLVISTDGRFGLWCDHHKWDDRVCVALHRVPPSKRI